MPLCLRKVTVCETVTEIGAIIAKSLFGDVFPNDFPKKGKSEDLNNKYYYHDKVSAYIIGRLMSYESKPKVRAYTILW